MKKYICIIPARAGSKRIKNKNLQLLGNKPLIRHTIDVALKCKKISKILVSTNSKSVINYTSKIKNSKILIVKRPSNISKDNSSTQLAILDAIKYLEGDEKNLDLILLQPTSPFRMLNHLNKAINKFEKNSNADCLVSAIKINHKFYPEKLMTIDEKNFLIPLIGKKYKLTLNKKNLIYARNGSAIYIIKNKNIKNFIVGGKVILFEMDFLSSIDIDDPEDLKLARIVYNSNKI